MAASLLMSLVGRKGRKNSSMVIRDSDALMSLEGLDSLRTVGGNVRIERSRMFNLSGLKGLTNIGGDVKIRDNVG